MAEQYITPDSESSVSMNHNSYMACRLHYWLNDQHCKMCHDVFPEKFFLVYAIFFHAGANTRQALWQPSVSHQSNLMLIRDFGRKRQHPSGTRTLTRYHRAFIRSLCTL
eukprot:scaffold553265_cov51-Prasinocladus_malaysianus.AAC.6